ncbi:MAG: dihydrofolate reductase family protein [Rubrobacter sp.]|nr:dihydrofolate reductase family protein [Rubrobacter sp.]
MPVRRLLPEPTARLAAEDLYTDISFPNREARPYLLINMISSLDGKVAVGGKAGSLGGPVDRTVMRNLRAGADAVMIGAGTLRAEKLTLAVPEDRARAREARGLKPQPLAVVATATGDVPLEKNLLGSSPENLLIFASSETPQEHLVTLSSRASVEIVAAETSKPGGRLDLEEALRALKERYGVNVLLVEGGTALNHALVSSGLADELFLTLAPKLLGGERPGALSILEGPALTPQKMEPKLVSIHLLGEELFLRYALRPKDGSHYS